MADENTFPPRQGSGQTGGPVTSPPSGKPTTAVRAGTRIIGTYEIEQLINKGGMGEVYRGRNIHNGEPVAIKIVLPHLAQDEMIAQLFQKEAKVLNRLVHDAIVRYYVFTSDPEIGRPCMVMEFVEGTSMNDRMKEGPMPEHEVRVLLRRVASGLEKAHQVGIVHRDLSPDNVILEGGTVENAKIIDFGIAKSTMKGDATLLQGQFAGKFSFVAPEQLGAYGGVVDGRTDIYSLALMMVAACQGKVLNMGKSIVEAVRCRGAIPDLSGVYPELRPLLAHMLEPDPAHRPESMGAVIKLLDNPDLIPEAGADDGLDPDRTVIVSSLPAMESAGPRENTGRASLPGKTGRGTQPPAAEFVGIPGGAKPAPAAPAKQGGKGGMVVALVALLAVGGGAGAYFSGMLGGAEPPAPVTPTQTTGTTTPDTTAAATTPPATPEPAAPATPAPAEPAAPSGTQTAATPPEPAPPEPAAQPTPPATTTAGTTDAPATPAGTPGGGQPAAGSTDTQAAATPPEPAPPAPEPTDPIDRQVAWVRAYDGGECVHVALTGRGTTAVELEGFGKSVDPFSALVGEFRAAHGVEPVLDTRVVNDPQCPIVNFMNTLQDNQGIPPNLILDNTSAVLKSGETVSGRIDGLAGRAVSLFLVNGAGGATNLKPFLSRASDGSTGFSFTVNLAPGAEPTPQLLLAVVTGEEVTKLDVVPNGVTARALVPFVTSQLTESRQDALGVLRYFRLEN